jgi:hypothetical protein
MDLKRELIRSGTHIALATIAGASLQPIIARPEVIAVGVQFANGIMVVGGTAVLVVIAGRAAFQIQRWNRLLPPPAESTAAPAVQFGTAMPAAGTLNDQRRIGDGLRRLDHDEEHSADRDERLRVLMVRYAFLGSQFPGARFSWRWMCKFMSRRDWTNCLDTMVSMGALRPARANIPPMWATGWYYSRFRIGVQFQHIALPYPDAEPLPEFRRAY